MPAGSDPVRLPHTWRPLGTRIAGLVGGVGLLLVATVAWIALGPDIRAKFTLADRITAIGLALLIGVCVHALVRARLVATDAGMVVVNGYRRRELVWAQVVAVRLRRGAPWAEMDLSDGTEIAVMALQGSDGDRAVDAVREVRRLVETHASPDLS